jgi:NADPH:quinone reductase
MRAVVLRRFGPPEELVLEQLPDPAARPGQVMITVDFASITFVETQIRSGHPPHPSMAPALPVILGNGVGGTITAVGPEVGPDMLGQRVVAATGGSGGYADVVAAEQAALIPVPAQVTTADATALLADGRTAMALIGAAALQPGATVLVEAAAGGVGSVLVQLAADAGATVIAAVGSPRKLEMLADLGAGRAVSYQEPGWADRVGAVDVVFDGIGGAIGEAAFGLLREGGRFMTYGMASGQFARIPDADAAARGVTVHRGAQVSPERMRALSSAALDLAAAGRLRPAIGQTFPLADAAAAHSAIESRVTRGKTLLSAAAS